MAMADSVRLSKADLHIHTRAGDGLASPKRVLAEGLRRQLQVIAITDHDQLDGARRAADLLATMDRPPIELIIGSEVSTRQGHLLALFIERPLPFFTSVEATIEAIKAQNGLVVIPHPLGRLAPSLSRRRIVALLEKGYPIDGIELYNPSPGNRAARARATALNQTWGLAATGGSDAHFWQHIGAAYTLFPGHTAADLRQAILSRQTQAGGMESSPEHVPWAAVVGQTVWSLFVDTPRKLLHRAHADSTIASGRRST